MEADEAVAPGPAPPAGCFDSSKHPVPMSCIPRIHSTWDTAEGKAFASIPAENVASERRLA